MLCESNKINDLHDVELIKTKAPLDIISIGAFFFLFGEILYFRQTDKNLRDKGVGKLIFVPPNEGEKFEGQDSGLNQTPQLSRKHAKSYIDIGNMHETCFSGGSNASKVAFLPFVEVNAQNWNTQKFNPTLLAKRVKLIADLVSGVRMRRNV